jgi:hypothetical protein
MQDERQKTERNRPDKGFDEIADPMILKQIEMRDAMFGSGWQ